MYSGPALPLVLVLCLAVGCAPKHDENAGTPAPFQARYADFVLDVPDRADLYQARNYSWGLVVSICPRHDSPADTPPLCEDLAGPLVNEFGLGTHVTEPRPDKRFVLLKERPDGVSSPPPKPLLPVPPERIDTVLNGPGEAYELSRLRVLDPNVPLSTTTNEWPMARCASGPQGARYCVIGFVIDGAFIESRIFAEEDVALDQKQVWDVASALDAKLRGLSPASGK